MKVSISPELARLQRDAGVIGFSAATAWEAIVLVAAGFDHVFIVNEIVDPAMVNAIAQAALSADLLVAADSRDNVQTLARAARAAGSELGVLVDVDTGMDRCGVASADKAVALAQFIADQPGLRFVGVTGYEGHCSGLVDRGLRRQAHVAAMASLVGAAELIEAHGIACPMRQRAGPPPGTGPRVRPASQRSKPGATSSWTTSTAASSRTSNTR